MSRAQLVYNILVLAISLYSARLRFWQSPGHWETSLDTIVDRGLYLSSHYILNAGKQASSKRGLAYIWSGFTGVLEMCNDPRNSSHNRHHNGVNATMTWMGNNETTRAYGVVLISYSIVYNIEGNAITWKRSWFSMRGSGRHLPESFQCHMA